MFGFFDDRVNRLIGYKGLHGFAVGLISIFIPVYVAQQGFSPGVVFSLLLVDVAAFTLLALPVGYAVSRLGITKSLLGSSLIYVLVFLVLQGVELNTSLVLSIGVLIGIAKAFHWIPVNSEFTAGSKSENRGDRYGKLEALPSILGTFAPLIGGAIMAYMGFQFLAGIAFIFGVASAVPLTLGKNGEKPEFDLSGMFSLDDLGLWTLYFLDGFATTVYVFIFPLFIFYVIGGELNVGAVKTIAGIGAALFAAITGKVTDRVTKTRLVLIGAVMSAIVYFVVPLVETSRAAFALSFVAGLTYMVYTIPLIAIIADIAEKGNILGFFSLREVFQGLGKITVVAVTVFVIGQYSLETAFEFAFYSAAFSVVLLALTADRLEKRV